jgi:hypothetical protein
VNALASSGSYNPAVAECDPPTRERAMIFKSGHQANVGQSNGKAPSSRIGERDPSQVVAATKVRVFASRGAYWLRRLLAHVTATAHAKSTSEHAIITYADARAIRRRVLARLTTFERALLWRWCIGVAVVCAGLFTALLAILVPATHAPP